MELVSRCIIDAGVVCIPRSDRYQACIYIGVISGYEGGDQTKNNCDCFRPCAMEQVGDRGIFDGVVTL